MCYSQRPRRNELINEPVSHKQQANFLYFVAGRLESGLAPYVLDSADAYWQQPIIDALPKAADPRVTKLIGDIKTAFSNTDDLKIAQSGINDGDPWVCFWLPPKNYLTVSYSPRCSLYSLTLGQPGCGLNTLSGPNLSKLATTLREYAEDLVEVL